MISAGKVPEPRAMADVQVPQPRALDELTLGELRSYRAALRAEEDRVSYWRRLTHGRMDVLTLQARPGRTLTQKELVRALADTGSGGRRTGLMRIAAETALPQLPEVDEIWSTHVDPGDTEAVEALLERLKEAERRLTEYRSALHRRIDEATAKLVERYRENPSQALMLLDRTVRK
ncbi:hypothetical protein [Nocardioides caldifontis]|uniref:RsiG family protein n=1 Tax=Nocardioides caldifontis TaxID=2588938 RepID=UPI00193AA7E9|nr:hypothetical protein [Nocardioides caldifontis]